MSETYQEERQAVTINCEGQKIFGILHLPKIHHPAPLVIFCHGYAGNKIGHRRLLVNMAEALVQKGIGALRFDFRSCGDSEGQFQDLSITSMQADLKVVWDSIQRDERIDSKRIGVQGVSLGGTITWLTLDQLPDVRSLSMWAPVASGKQWLADWEKKQHEGGFSYIESNGQKASSELIQQFLSFDIEEVVSQYSHIPFQHIQGMQDQNVLPVHADLYRLWRSNAQGESHFIIIENCGHDFSEAQETVLQETLKWFKRTL